jgi:hypothetical protein
MKPSAGDTRHATSRYQEIATEVVHELQRAFRDGVDLKKIAVWLSVADKRVIVAETLDADRVVAMPARVLASDDAVLEPGTDYKFAVAAEKLMTASGQGQDAPLVPRAAALLRAIGNSPTASPMLSYELLYRDLAEAALLESDQSAIRWLERVLAHNLAFHDGDDVLFGLIDLASAYLQLDDLDRGLGIIADLIEHNPSEKWIYRFMATGFGVLGLADLGVRGARKGLALLDEVGDPDDLHDELLMAEFDLLASPKRGRETVASAAVLARINAALQLPFRAADGRSPAALCRDLVPDLEAVPVKRHLLLADLPPSVRALVT